MGKVYKVINNLNGKMYIGQTHRSLEERLKEHISESKKKRSEGVKLYDVMREYGVGNFSIKEIEKVEDSLLEAKALEYIRKYNTTEEGYNIVGKGSQKLDITDEELIELYERCGSSLSELERKLNCCRKTLSIRLNALGVKTNNFDKRFTNEDILVCKNQKGEEQARFNTCKEAANWVIENHYTEGTDVRNIGFRIKAKAKIKGKIYGFKWEIVEG